MVYEAVTGRWEEKRQGINDIIFNVTTGRIFTMVLALCVSAEAPFADAQGPVVEAHTVSGVATVVGKVVSDLELD
ncbi:MAG: hypothetical protein VCA74_01180 [Deltaproteobacteria bacterium]